ncbi:MAG TPA: NADH-quinone oxidoreductase subunit N [Solirubrobacterales bacterium]|jgi:NADH-quinone oxidoreductase subunit N|nr:NADH-quinone oxidoreductase subunit N [Solirubrobacterales bacterium]
MTFEAPHIDYAGISPVLALTAGLVVVLLAGVFTEGSRERLVVSALSFATLAAAAGLCIWQWGEGTDLVAGALRLDDLGLAGGLIAIASAAFCIPLSWREEAADRASGPTGHAEFQALLLCSVLGMVLLAQAQNLISFFVSLELLSVPLYVLCGSALRRRESLESGLKYLIIGSLGSATLLYGLAFVYGASGSTDFAGIRAGIGGDVLGDPLLLIGIGLAATGLAFKLSVAPFHQWTPDVYQGAPTPVTAFMAVATKAAAFCVLVRFFYVALGPAVDDWQPALAALGAVSIVIGNVGALGQNSLKRLLGYSGVAQAGYMLVGVAAFSEAGVSALIFYLAAYALMNLAAFAVITIRERETPHGDDIRAVEGLGRERPELAWPLTISMLALAGLPGTAGFIGKLFLIEAAVDADYTWLGVAIAVGTMISLAYYLRVVAAVWMRPSAKRVGAEPEPLPAIAGGSPEADAEDFGIAAAANAGAAPPGTRCRTIIALTVLAAAATVFFGIVPSPLVDWAANAGEAIAAALPV